jgi:hypothetical protein
MIRATFEGKPNSRVVQVVKWSAFWLALVGVVAASCFLLVDGGMSASKREILAGALIAVAPVLIYVAITKPFIFPFGLYVLLVPFDNILRIDSFGTLTKLLAVLSGAVFAFWLVRNKHVIKPSRVLYIWLALLLWMALTVFWATDSDSAVGHLITYAELMMLYAIVSILPQTNTEFKTLLTAVVLGGLLAAAFSLYQYHTGGINVRQANVGQELTSRVFVQAGEDKINPNAFAAALLLPISLVLMATLQSAWSFKKIALGACFLVMLGGLYVSGSRGALLALAGMLGYFLWRSRYRGQVGLLCLAGIAVTVPFAARIFARFSDAISTGGAGRLSIWKVGLESLKHYWLAGAGVGDFPFAYDQSYIRIYQQYDAHWHRVSHNSFLTMAVELGIFGLVLGLIAWWGQGRMLRFITESNPLYDLRTTLEGAIIALAIAAFFLELSTDKYAWLVFLMIAATRAYALSMSESRAPAPQSPIQIMGSGMFPNQPPQKVPINA